MSRYSTWTPAMMTAQQLGGNPNMLAQDPLLTGNQIIQNLIAYGQFQGSNPQKYSPPLAQESVRQFQVNQGGGAVSGPFS